MCLSFFPHCFFSWIFSTSWRQSVKIQAFLCDVSEVLSMYLAVNWQACPFSRHFGVWTQSLTNFYHSYPYSALFLLQFVKNKMHWGVMTTVKCSTWLSSTCCFLWKISFKALLKVSYPVKLSFTRPCLVASTTIHVIFPSIHTLTVSHHQQHLFPPVQWDVPLHPLQSPSSFVTAHLCAQQGASCYSRPWIDSVQLFPNPALDFDPLPFKRTVPEDTSDLVVVCGRQII